MEVQDMLVKAYKDVKTEIGNDLSYLGMRINMREGDVVISMNEYALDVLAYYPDVRNYIRPATADIYETKETEMLTEDKKKEFHSTTIKLFYLAKRVRPDILFAVQFLRTRVKSPDAEDWRKLMRGIGYLNV